MTIGRSQEGHHPAPPVILQSGTSPSGATWELRYSVVNQEDCLGLYVDGAELGFGCGFDIPTRTEIGFAGGLKPGEGDFYLYGLTSARVTSITAESSGSDSEVQTQRIPDQADRPALRFFALVREPVDNVTALVGLDVNRELVQRIKLK